MPSHIQIADNADPRDRYVVGGAPTSAFTVTFFFFDIATDVGVVKTVAGVDTELVWNVDYTVVGNTNYLGGFDGGAVNLTNPVTNCQITTYLKPPLKRTDDFATSGPFDIPTLNTTLDRFVTLVQRVHGILRRVPRFATSSAASFLDMLFPTPVADKYLGWNSAGTLLVNLNKPNGIYNGSGAPSPTLGIDGDFYFDNVAVKVYGPKAAGVWPGPSTFTGPVGPQGPAGLNGAGDVSGPAGATDGQLVLFNGATGKLIKAGAAPAASATTDTTNATNIASGTLADARHSANIPLKNVVNAWSKGQAGPSGALTDAATVAWDMDAVQEATLTTAAARTMVAPTNHLAGRTVTLTVTTGGFNLSFNANFIFDAPGAPVISGYTKAKFAFEDDGTNMRYLGFRGYAS